MDSRLIELVRQGTLEQAREALAVDDPILRILESTFAFVDVPRLRNLRQRCLEARPGAFVECGVAQGASLAMMAACAGGRPIWGFDSFEGLPALSDGDEGDGDGIVGYVCSGPQGAEAVHATFDALSLSLDEVTLVKGWFEDTLPATASKVGPISLLRLDSDFHDSTLLSLEHLYHQVVEGGAVIVDDYHTFTGCRNAVDLFRRRHGIDDPLILTDSRSEVWWTKRSPLGEPVS